MSEIRTQKFNFQAHFEKKVSEIHTRSYFKHLRTRKHYFCLFFSTKPTKSSTARRKIARLTRKVGGAANGADLKSASPADFSQVRYFTCHLN